MIKISVVIPVYNRAGLILETLASVEEQVLPPAEVIIVNDGSTDNSVEIIQAYQKVSNLNIQLYDNGNKKGQSGALNYGISKARGDYIAMLDSDDLWAPYHLKQLCDALERYSSYDFAFSKTQVFGPAKDAEQKNIDFDQTISLCLREAFDKQDNYFWKSNKHLLRCLLERGVPFRCPASLIRASFFQKWRLFFDEEISYCLDAHFMVLAAYYASFVYVANVGMKIRRHAENDGDRGYGTKICESHRLRVRKLKNFFVDKKLTAEERKGLRRLLWGLQSYVMFEKSQGKNVFLRALRALEMICHVPCWMSVKSAAKNILSRKASSKVLYGYR